jgi:hypothetical protein
VTSSCAGKIGLREPGEHTSGPNLASRDNVAHNPTLYTILETPPPVHAHDFHGLVTKSPPGAASAESITSSRTRGSICGYFSSRIRKRPPPLSNRRAGAFLYCRRQLFANALMAGLARRAFRRGLSQ